MNLDSYYQPPDNPWADGCPHCDWEIETDGRQAWCTDNDCDWEIDLHPDPDTARDNQ